MSANKKQHAGLVPMSNKTTPPLRGTPPEEGNNSPSPKGWQAKPDGVVPKLRFPEFLEAGEWEKGKIGDLFKLDVKSEKASEFNSEKIITVKLHAHGIVKNERTNTLTGGANYFKRSANEFIFSKIDLLNGAFGLVPTELDGFYSSSDVPSFTFKKTSSSLFFLNWLKANYWKLKIERTGTSSTLKRVSPRSFLDLPLPVPTPREQQKIADCLTSLDDLIRLEAEKLEALKAHKKGLMQQLFPAEGETLPKLRFPEFQNAGEWELEQFGSLGTFIGGGTPDKSVDAYWNGTIPWVSSSDILEDDVNTLMVSRYITVTAVSESATKIVPMGSLLFVSRVGIGKVAISDRDVCTSQDFTNFQPKSLLNSFIAYFFSANKQVLKSFGQGTSIKGFTKEDLAKFQMPFPSRAEQQKIADCLSSLDTQITTQAEKLETLKVHKKSLMQQLFPKS